MSRYVDGFVLPLKEDQAEAYLKIAEAAGKIWMDHGALAYVECLGDDLHVEEMTPFPVMVVRCRGNRGLLMDCVPVKRTPGSGQRSSDG
jgi:uncharacterized protein YbaA (DUF1428 family)